MIAGTAGGGGGDGALTGLLTRASNSVRLDIKRDGDVIAIEVPAFGTIALTPPDFAQETGT